MAGSQALDDAVVDYDAAAEYVLRLVAGIDDDRWDGPGLGEWSLRSLVGHTGRSFTTVTSYLAEPEPANVDLDSTAGYYAAIQGLTEGAGVLERGVAAGVELGDDPVAGLRQRAQRALEVLAGASDRPIATPFGGILLSHYLPTRTFELAVHGLDIARAIGVPDPPPEKVLASALVNAATTAVRIGKGARALLVLTGRETGPISVV